MVRRAFLVLGIIIASVVSIYLLNLLGTFLDTTPHDFGIGLEGRINRAMVYMCDILYGVIICLVFCLMLFVVYWVTKAICVGIVELFKFIGNYIKNGVQKG